VFILLGRDIAAPDTIRHWAQTRIDLRQNSPEDKQIVDALDIADRMEKAR